jgi:hypothetical protein
VLHASFLCSLPLAEPYSQLSSILQKLSGVAHRDVYNPSELLGGSSHAFMVGNMEASRIDYELVRVGSAHPTNQLHAVLATSGNYRKYTLKAPAADSQPRP